MPRLDQLLASLGYGSRREVNALIGAGEVAVKGSPARDGAAKVSPSEVLVGGAPLDHPDGVLLMLHKSAGRVCSHDPKEGPSIYGLLPPRWRARLPQITSIGRLDKDTSGLLLLTDRTVLVHRLTSPKNKVPKTYLATLERALAPARAAELTAAFASGELMLHGESRPCAPAELRWHETRTAEVTLTEGRYHQVRRMFASQGCTVTALQRICFGPLELGDLAPDTWRELPLDFFE